MPVCRHCNQYVTVPAYECLEPICPMKRRQDEDESYAPTPIPASDIGYQTPSEPTPSSPVAPSSEPEVERGGSFGGGGASASWDSGSSDSGGSDSSSSSDSGSSGGSGD